MRRREFLLAALGGSALRSGVGQSEERPSSRLRLATFRCDVTPPIGEPLIWVTPTVKVEDPLWAKGIVLEDGRHRYVLCAIDWCALSSSTHRLFRGKIAAASGTEVSRVALQSVHQHTAPYVDSDACELLARLKIPLARLSQAFLDQVMDRLAQAVKESVARLQPFDQIGAGQAKVDRVASARRIRLESGQMLTRYSTDGRKPEMAAFPEGRVDAWLKTITFSSGAKPLARLHYYATHPQTFCCDGRVSGDFVSAAREGLERKEGVFQIYFTGCAGDVTVGKYNDTSEGSRNALAQRLREGMEASIASTRLASAGPLKWRSVPLRLPLHTGGGFLAAQRKKLESPDQASPTELYEAAIGVVFSERKSPLETSSLEIGKVRIVHLPGEPMLDFQLYAQGLKPADFVAVAGYADCSAGYLCTDLAFDEGGYEPSASNSGKGAEAQVRKTIRLLLGA